MLRVEDFLEASVAAGRRVILKGTRADAETEEESVEKKAERALIRKRTLADRPDFSMPPSMFEHRTDGNLEKCMCDNCSDIKEKLPHRRRISSATKFITPTRGTLDTVLCSPAPYAARKSVKNGGKYAR